MTRTAMRRLHRDGYWHMVVPGIRSTLVEPPWLGLAWAGILQSVDGVIGGRAAGHLYGICPEPTVIDVWSSIRRRGGDTRWRFRRGVRQPHGSPPKTRIETTALDICQDETAPGIVSVLAKAVGSRRTTAARLRAAVLDTATLRNRGLVLDMLADIASGVESPLELHYLKYVERAHNLPPATRQISISQGTRSDVGYPQFGLLVELDGQVWHEGLAAWTDMARDNCHGLLSFITLRFGWHAVVSDPCAVALQVADALQQGGWSSSAGRCPRCG